VSATTLSSILLLGLLLGVRHALDADHLAAVATLASRSRSLRQSVGLGVSWGLGHTLTLTLFGGAVLLLGHAVPEHAANVLELAVGVMLVALGGNVLYRVWREGIHAHWHRHDDGVVHLHAHSHRAEAEPHDRALHQHDHLRGRWSHFSPRALLVGMVHGLAGSAALLVLSLEVADSAARGLAYLAIFGLGSILGMAALSVVIAVPLRWSSARLTRLHGVLSALIGTATIVLGGHVVYQTVLALAA
jgi:ABC-type nickel/cobalt efflux system permease component RcnA